MSDYAAYPEIQSESDAIARRRKIAEAMMAQGQAPLESMGTAGGAPIPISWTQGLAKLVQAYQGGRGVSEADVADKDLAVKGEAARADAIRKVQESLAPTPGSPMPDPSLGGGPAMPPTERSPEDKLAAIRDAVLSKDPRIAALGAFEQQNLAAKEARASAAEQRRSDLEFAASEKRDAAALAAKNEMKEIAEKHRLGLITAKQAQDAAAESRRQHDATLKAIAGMQRATTLAVAEGKVSKNEASSDTGRKTVSDLVAQLGGYYDELAASGGITDPKKGVVANIGAGIASSGVGQFVGRMTGTQNQSSRNSIAQQRPLLLNAIKQATGMSAKQMDSNAELKMYLSAATDPTLDVAANRSALAMLDKLYGLGESAPTPSKETTRVVDW